MSLTMGSGPLAEARGGEANFAWQGRALWLEPSARRLRVRLGGETLADSCDAKRLHESGCLPVYYFPRADVRGDLLEPSAKRTRCPYKGEASYWSALAGGKRAEDAVWAYEDPIESARFLRDHLAFDFDALDEWLEEDAPIVVHPRDPYHRVDVLPSSRRARVLVHGREVARSDRPRLLFETGLPPRVYFDAGEVDARVLEPSATRTRCPYKGEAEHRHLRLEDAYVRDGVWRYATPLPEAADIAGRWCFYAEKDGVELELEGARPPHG